MAFGFLRLTIFSPWPPKASGISDYAARLASELTVACGMPPADRTRRVVNLSVEWADARQVDGYGGEVDPVAAQVAPEARDHVPDARRRTFGTTGIRGTGL